MFGFIRDAANAIAQFAYQILNEAINLLTGRGAPLPPWSWTVVSDPAAPARNNEIDELIKAYMQQHGVKAGQFSLFVDENLTMSSAYTWGESSYPITQTTSVMRVASCSKAFTTAAIMELRTPTAGIQVLRMEEKVFDILSSSPNQTFTLPVDTRVLDITVKDLIEHTGGWNYKTGPNAINDWVFHLKEIGRRLGLPAATGKWDFARFVLCDTRLDFEPGTQPDELFTPPGEPTEAMDTYSNIGYQLLGMIVDVRASSYMRFLSERILQPLGIGDVSVGATRRDQRLPNEVLYESPYFGPDATRGPYDVKPARLPYGGDGSRKEVMDSSGGLIMSANSLARFIGNRNVWLTRLDPTKTLAELMQRSNATRYGSMPGTQAVAHCFSNKGFSKRYDMALIVNKQDLSKTDPGDGNDDFERLVARLERKILEVF